MCVLMEEMAQHRMGLYNPGAGVFGRTPPPVIWAGTEEQIQKYAVPAIKNASYTFFAITEPSRRIGSRRRDPMPRGAQGRHLRPERHQDFHLARA